MFYEINRNLCITFNGLDPIKLLDYPAVDVFELINQTMAYNQRNSKDKSNNTNVIRKQAGDNWF